MKYVFSVKKEKQNQWDFYNKKPQFQILKTTSSSNGKPICFSFAVLFKCD